jgi:hypothetical protein
MEPDASLPHSCESATSSYPGLKDQSKSEAFLNGPSHGKFLKFGIYSVSFNPQNVTLPLFKYSRLFIQYIRNYPLYL